MTPNSFEKQLTKYPAGRHFIACLRENGLLNTPEKIVNLGAISLLKQRNITKKNLIVLALLLQEFNYIKDAKEWLYKDSSQKTTHCPNCGFKL